MSIPRLCFPLALVLCGLGALAWPSGVPEVAARSSLERQRKAQARALFAQAEVKYNLGQFAEALDLYSKAYEVLPLPGFLFNIGQCHRNLARPERAIFFYQGYLRSSRKVANRELVEQLIVQCQDALKAEQVAAEARRRAEEHAARQAATRRAAEAAARRAAVTPPPEALARPGSDRPQGGAVRVPLYRRWWFWTALAAGVVAVATGVGVGVSARPDPVLPSGSLGTVDAR